MKPNPTVSPRAKYKPFSSLMGQIPGKYSMHRQTNHFSSTPCPTWTSCLGALRSQLTTDYHFHSFGAVLHDEPEAPQLILAATSCKIYCTLYKSFVLKATSELHQKDRVMWWYDICHRLCLHDCQILVMSIHSIINSNIQLKISVHVSR